MTKVGKAWSWLAARTKGSGSSPKPGLPYKDFPTVPVPKTRKRSRYSIVIVSESGTSRQVDLTTFRIRAGALGLAGCVCLLAILLLWVGASFLGKPTSDEPTLVARLKALETELREKELALAVQKKQMEEGRELAAARPAVPGQGLQTSIPQQPAVSGARTEDGPLTSLPVPGARGAGALFQEQGDETSRVGAEERPPSPGGVVARSTPGTERSRRVPERRPQTQPGGDALRVVNFNAEDVTVVAQPGNRGTISFRLVKDQHDVRFSGYLFVFVEIVDKRGEPKLYAYPDRTQVEAGDDLPRDFHAGESLSFKYNSRVELPYKDVRPGAKLARVSILLYGEDGNIVFQRAFSRSEVKMVSAKATNVTDQQPKPVKKRQAL